ncbi:MAG: pilus assembly protein PilM [Cellvibrionaceae bacterium]
MLSILTGKRRDVGLVGIEASDDGLAIAHVITDQKSGVWLKQCEYIDTDNDANQSDILSKKIEDMGLSDLPCNWVLRPSNYSLLLIEAPNVPDEEMKEAVRWKIKDLIPVAVEDVVIDVFTLPEDGTRSGKKMIYVVASEKSYVQGKVDLVKDVNLLLESIDIVEMAVRNISEVISEDERGIAIVRLRPNAGNLLLMKKDKLYLSRQFDLKYNGGLFDELPEDSLILELQRSLDYYERQMGQAAPASIFFCGDNISEDKITSTMKNSLTGAVKFLDLKESLKMPEDYDEQKIQMCIGAIGGALRQRSKVQ